MAERVEKAIEDTDKRLAARFDREKAKGTLPDDFPSLERAALLYDIRQGYMFRGRAGWDALFPGFPEEIALITSKAVAVPFRIRKPNDLLSRYFYRSFYFKGIRSGCFHTSKVNGAFRKGGRRRKARPDQEGQNRKYYT